MTRLFAIAYKELLQLRRDRLSFAMIVVLPIVQLLLFGYAIDTDVKHIPTVVYDQDQSPSSRQIAKRIEATRYIDLVDNVRSYAEVDSALRSGAADAALIFPPDFQQRIGSNRDADLQFIVNGVDPTIVGSALGAVEGAVGSLSQQIMTRRASLHGQVLKEGKVQLLPLIKYNPDRRSAIFIVPGLLGVILTLTMVMFTSIALSRERERGTMEALMVSPVRRWEIIAGKILPYVGVGYVQMSLILLAATQIFHVPFAGSWPLLYLLAAPFIIGNLAVGIAFSTVARTQQQAMQLSFFFLLPNILLSGFMFPYQAMPRPAQVLSSGLPLTHFVNISRRVILQNASFSELREQFIWLVSIVIVLCLFASLRFRKKLL